MNTEYLKDIVLATVYHKTNGQAFLVLLHALLILSVVVLIHI